jgi:hypothetical protein
MTTSMKPMTTMKWMAVLSVLLLAVPAGASPAPALKTQKEKVSYGIGVDMAKNFKQQGIEFDADILIKGFKDQSFFELHLVAIK